MLFELALLTDDSAYATAEQFSQLKQHFQEPNAEHAVRVGMTAEAGWSLYSDAIHGLSIERYLCYHTTCMFFVSLMLISGNVDADARSHIQECA